MITFYLSHLSHSAFIWSANLLKSLLAIPWHFWITDTSLWPAATRRSNIVFSLLAMPYAAFFSTSLREPSAYDLITNQKVADGSRKLVEKKASYGMASREKTIFDRLVAAGQRLVSVIQKCQGMANKDLSKFADQINALCDKWDR